MAKTHHTSIPSSFWDPLFCHQLQLCCHPQGPLDFPGATSVWVHPPPSGHPWLVPPVAWMPGPLMALHLGWACWGEARYWLPYPAYVCEHQRDGCSSWQCTLSPAYPTGVGYRAPWACSAIPWLLWGNALWPSYQYHTRMPGLLQYPKAGAHHQGGPGPTQCITQPHPAL